MTSQGVRIHGTVRSLVALATSPLSANVVGLVVLLLLIGAGVGLLPDVDGTPDWWSPLAAVDVSLASGDLHTAVRQWHEARAEALAARNWEGLIEVGDAYRRLGRAGGFVPTADATARRLYLTALSTARGQASVDGALRAADAFAGLGERALAEASLVVAARIARDDTDEEARVRGVARRARERPPSAAR